MKKVGLLVLLVLGVILGSTGQAFAAGSHPLTGYILPTGTNYTPADYKIWLSTNASLTHSGTVSWVAALNKTRYQDNVGNWYTGWSNGEILIAKVEKANAAEAGAGLFSASSVTLSSATASQTFTDMPALVAIPQPTATANAGAGNVSVSWTAVSGMPAGTIAGYKVYRSTDGTTFTALSGTVTGTSYTDTSGTAGTAYYYAIRMVFTGGVETTNRSVKSSAVTYPAAPVTPTLSSATPSSGTQGQTLTSVAIVGANTHFGAGSAVSFGAGITSGIVTVADATHLTVANVVISASAATGARTVTVTTPAVSETASGSIFTVSALPTPSITKFQVDTNPDPLANTWVDTTSAIVYDHIKIVGTNFGADPGDGNRDTATNKVTIAGSTIRDDAGNSGLQVYSWNTTEIEIGIPRKIGSTFINAGANAIVVTAGGVASSSTSLNIKPHLYAIVPDSGMAASSTIVKGTALEGTARTISFSGTSAGAGSIVREAGNDPDGDNGTDNVTVTVPAGIAAGAKSVSATVSSQASDNTMTYTVTATPVPVLTSATPSSGTQGTTVASIAIVGTDTHFVGGTTAISFGANITSGTVTVADSTHLTVSNVAIALSAATGPRTVTVTTGSEIASGSIFTVTAAPTPTLVSATPASGIQGQTITSVAIVGQNTHFTLAAPLVSFGSNITVGSVTVTDDTHLTVANVVISASAATGARSVTVTTGSEIATGSIFTVNAVPLTPTLISANPASGIQGQTVASVEITGVNTTFNSSAAVDFGAGITHGAVTANSATSLTVANVAISATAATGLRNVVVTTGTQVASGEIFTVNAAPPPPTSDATTVVIDDYEGTLVLPTSYYQFGPSDPTKPVTTIITSDFHEGLKSIKTTYAAATDGWRGWGAVVASNKNISSMANITFWMKGDGTANKVKIQLKDADGDNYAIADVNAIPVSGTTWQQYTVPISTISLRVGTEGNGNLNLSQISQYQFVFTGSAATAGNGILIDYVVATQAAGPTGEADPVITAVSPATGTQGTSVTIDGTGFGTAGSLLFSGQGVQTIVNSTAGTGETQYISVWDATRVVLTLPSIGAGEKTIRLTRASDGRQSNTITFVITAPTPEGVSGSYNYPNPFNPLAGGTTKIVFSPGTATNATAYIFDTTARVVSKLTWTAGASTETSVTWDGRNAFSEIQGDGVYLYRVVDAGSRILGKGKILVVNK